MAANIEAIVANQGQTIGNRHKARVEELAIQDAAYINFMSQQDVIKQEILELRAMISQTKAAHSYTLAIQSYQSSATTNPNQMLINSFHALLKKRIP